MLDLYASNRKRSEVADLNIVPILDMLISVIFFLLLTTSFLQFTKQSVPPSSIKKITDPVLPPPLQPRFMAINMPTGLRLFMNWTGSAPGHDSKDYVFNKATIDPEEERAGLKTVVMEMVNDFTSKFPQEKTLEIGLGADVPYQDLITIMDSVKDKMPDMVLFSYLEAQLRTEQVKPNSSSGVD